MMINGCQRAIKSFAHVAGSMATSGFRLPQKLNRAFAARWPWHLAVRTGVSKCTGCSLLDFAILKPDVPERWNGGEKERVQKHF